MTHLYKVLGYCAAIPFVCTALGLFLFEGLADWLLAFMLVYAGLISCFRAGMHWAHALVTKSEGQMLLSMLPVAISLILTCWAVLMIAGGLVAELFGQLLLSCVATVYILLYSSLFIMDAKWLDPDLLAEGYIKAQFGVTSVVIACLMASIVFLWI